MIKIFSFLVLLALAFAQQSIPSGEWMGFSQTYFGAQTPVVLTINNDQVTLLDERGLISGTISTSGQATGGQATGSQATGSQQPTGVVTGGAQVTGSQQPTGGNPSSGLQQITFQFQNESLKCLFQMVQIRQEEMLQMMCRANDFPTDLSFQSCTSRDCISYNLTQSTLHSSCVSVKLALVHTPGLSNPLQIFRPILDGFRSNQTQPGNSSQLLYKYGQILGFGIRNMYNMGKVYENIFIEQRHLLQKDQFLNEYIGLSSNFSRDVQSVMAFSQGLYSISEPVRDELTGEFAVPIDNQGINVIPVYTIGKNDPLLNPLNTCPAFSNRQMSLEQVMSRNSEAVNRFNSIIDQIHWTNFGLPGLPNGQISFRDVLMHFQIDVNSPQGMFIVVEMLVEAMRADLVLQRPLLGEANANVVSASDIFILQKLRDEFWFFANNDNNLNSLVSQPILSDINDFFLSEGGLSQEPNIDLMQSFHQNAFWEPIIRSDVLREYSSEEFAIEPLAILLGFISEQNPLMVPFPGWIDMELVKCLPGPINNTQVSNATHPGNNTRQDLFVWTKFMGMPMTINGCSANPCPFNEFESALQQTFSINYQQQCQQTSQPTGTQGTQATGTHATQATQGTQATAAPGTQATQGTQATAAPGTQGTQPAGTQQARNELRRITLNLIERQIPQGQPAGGQPAFQPAQPAQPGQGGQGGQGGFGFTAGSTTAANNGNSLIYGISLLIAMTVIALF